MTFQNLQWLYLAVPLLLVLVVVRFWRRHYWGHSLVEHFGAKLGGPNPILRLPALLEGLAVGFLLVALLGPVYPFVLTRIEPRGLPIMFVLDLSQSMEENLGNRNQPPAAPRAPAPGSVPKAASSKLEAVKA